MEKGIILYRSKYGATAKYAEWLAVFCVGASPYEKKAFEELYAHNFKNGMKGIPCFYCR